MIVVSFCFDCLPINIIYKTYTKERKEENIYLKYTIFEILNVLYASCTLLLYLWAYIAILNFYYFFDKFFI